MPHASYSLGCFCIFHSIHHCSSQHYWPLVRLQVVPWPIASTGNMIVQCKCCWTVPLHLLVPLIRSGAINASLGVHSVVLSALKALFLRHAWTLVVFLYIDRFDGLQRSILKAKLMYFCFQYWNSLDNKMSKDGNVISFWPSIKSVALVIEESW